MRYTYNAINKLNKTADEIISLNPEVICKEQEFDVRSTPYLKSKVHISKLILPKGWEIRNNSIVNRSNLFRIDIKYDTTS